MISHSPAEQHMIMCSGPCWCTCLTCYACRNIALRGGLSSPNTNNREVVVRLIDLAVAISELPHADQETTILSCQMYFDSIDHALWENIVHLKGDVLTFDGTPSVFLTAIHAPVRHPRVFTTREMEIVNTLCLGLLRGDGLARRDVETGVYELEYVPSLGDVVVDLGAHAGFFTNRAAGRVGASGLVISVEPEPRNFLCMQNRVQSMANVRTMESAVSNISGHIPFVLNNETTVIHSKITGKTRAGEGSPIINVRSVTLGDLVSIFSLSKIDFIKVDIEGAEADVLESGREVIEKMRPHLAIEVEEPDIGKRIMNVLRELDYTVDAVTSVVDVNRSLEKTAVMPSIWFANPNTKHLSNNHSGSHTE